MKKAILKRIAFYFAQKKSVEKITNKIKEKWIYSIEKVESYNQLKFHKFN